jgi:6-pyruvoyltetrahydropterin/6-carboxytetrahydropterin synthase
VISISKKFRFSASHKLDGLPPGHKCSRLHGHNYEVVITLAGETDGAGMVLDYGELKLFSDYLDRTFDHRHLGSGALYDATGALVAEPVCNYQTTAENLAAALLDTAMAMFGELVQSVTVKETENTDAIARA